MYWGIEHLDNHATSKLKLIFTLTQIFVPPNKTDLKRQSIRQAIWKLKNDSLLNVSREHTIVCTIIYFLHVFNHNLNRQQIENP